MRRRPWVLAVALLVLALAFSAVVTIRYLNRSTRLKQEIQRMFANVPGDLEIGRAEIEATTLFLTDVTYRSPDSTVVARIKRISLRFAVTNWFKHSGGIERLVHSISVVDPEVSLRLEGGKSGSKAKGGEFRFPDLSKYAFLERLIVRNGQFNLVDRRQNTWMHLHGIDGWILGGNARRVRFELASAIGQDTLRALLLHGTADLVDREVDARADLKAYNLANVSMPASAPVNDFRGLFDFHGHAVLADSSLKINANWALTKAQIQVVGGPLLDRIDLTGIYENRVATTQGSCRMEEDSATVRASFDLTKEPLFQAHARIREGRLGKHLETFAHLPRRDGPKGEVDLSADFVWKPRSKFWSVNGIAYSDKMGTPVGDFRDIRMRLSWDRRDNALRFDKVTSTWYGMDVTGMGRWRPERRERFLVDFDVKGRVDPSTLPKWASPLATKSTESKVSIRNTPDAGWVIEGRGRAHGEGDPSLGEFHGVYTPAGYDVQFNLYPPRLQDASVHLSAKHHGSMHVSTQAPQVLANWWDAKYKISDRLMKLNVQADADLGDGKIQSNAVLRDPGTDFSLELFGSVNRNLDTTRTFNFSYNLLRHQNLIGNGDFEVKYGDGVLDILRFTFMDYFAVAGKVDLKNRKFENLDLVVEDLDLADLVPRVSSLPRDQVAGQINGRLNITGAFKNPVLDAHFELFEAQYGDLKQYWGLLTLGTDVSGNVFIRQGAFGRAGTTIFTMLGTYSIPDDNLDLSIVSPGSDANVLARALTGRDGVLTGTISLAARVKGPLLMPSWNADLGMSGANVLGIRFDDVSLSMHGETTKRLGHVLYLDEFDLSRTRHYRLQAFGAAPLSRGAGQVSVVLDGAILELLPQMTSFIKSARGTGELNWTLTIVAGKIAATRGSLQIGNGALSFEDVFPEMRGIDVDVQVDVEGKTDIKQMDATLAGDYPVVIRNTPGDPGNPNEQPIVLRTLGLDLGVLELKTPDEDGIPMRIPDVMTTPEYAQIKFAGLNGGDWFTISGPTDSLLFTGSATVAKMRMTYPPLKSGGAKAAPSKPHGILKLLDGARWNSRVRIAQDVHYEREVRGLENSPFMQAFSDLISQLSMDLTVEPTEPDRPLEVSGRIADGSFRLKGELLSTQGTIDFLDLSFQMQRAEVVFDQTSLLPVVSARAVTSVVDQQSQFSRQVYLTLYVIDPVTGERTSRGRWGDFTFVLEDDEGSSQEQVLSTLGYDIGSLQQRMTTIGVGSIDRAVTRRVLRPLERDVARWLGLDLVRFDPSIAQSLLASSTDSTGAAQSFDFRNFLDPRKYFSAGRLTVGKYLTRDLFLSYTGQLGGDPMYTTFERAQRGRTGLLQTWSLEYRVTDLSPNFVVQGDWEYDNVENLNNRSLRLKYTFLYDFSRINWRRTLRSLTP